MSMFYVLNLTRRTDRKTDFTKRFNDLEISDPLEFVEAIDGSKQELNRLGNYENPRLAATAQSHYKIWKLIAESDKSYGVVLEDDILFHNNFKKQWLKIKNKLKGLTQGSSIEFVYLGMGDCLPIHTRPPSQTLLDSQEKSHVIKNSVIHDYFGIPNPKSPYIFDWFGTFSYVLTKKGAQKLIDSFDSYKTGPIDKWIKESTVKKHVTIPLLTYHPSIDKNIYDTDVTNTFVPISENNLLVKNYPTTAFLIVVPNSENYNLEDTILSILRNARSPNNVVFAFRVCYGDTINLNIIKNLKEGNYDKDGVILKPSVCLIQGPVESKLSVNEDYKNLWHCFFKMADFIVCWEYDKIISEDWDFVLNNYHCSHGQPKIACYQIQSNIERNVNALNSSIISDNTNEFNTPFLTNKLAEIIEGVGPCVYFNEFLKYVCYLSKITILVRDISSRCISDNTYENEKEKIRFFQSVTIKLWINTSVLNIKKHQDYINCGIWVDMPEEWATTGTVGESRLN